MGWFGSGAYVDANRQFDYFNLEEFKSRTCFTPVSYVYLQITILFSIFLYALDIYVAVNLLAHNSWNKEITPWIPFDYAKWIFTACILLSFVMLAYEWLRAYRVIRRRGVAENYLDPIAARAQTLGKGGWHKFNLFAHLTKSKKGADYVAFYAYFSFQRWYRTIFADGPRQAVNGATVVFLVRNSIVPGAQHPITKGNSGFTQFFANIGAYADQDRNKALVLSSMTCSLVIWAFFMINLFIAMILYICFLWHHIPAADGSLYRFCKRKIDSRLSKVAEKIAAKTKEKEEAKMRKKEAKEAKKADKEPVPGIKRAPALGDASLNDDKLSDMPGLSRTTTSNTLSTDIATPSSAIPRGPDFPDLTKSPYRAFSDNGPPTMSSAQLSISSNASYASNAPLLRNGSAMGHNDGYFDQRPGTAGHDAGTPYDAHGHEMLPYPRSNAMYPGPTAPMPTYGGPLGQRGFDSPSSFAPPMSQYPPGPPSIMSGRSTPMSARPPRQASLERLDTNVGPYAQHSRELSDPLDSYFDTTDSAQPNYPNEYGRSTPSSGHPNNRPSNELNRSTPMSGNPSRRPSYEGGRSSPYSNPRAPSRASHSSQRGPVSGRSTPLSRNNPSRAGSVSSQDNYSSPAQARPPSNPYRRPPQSNGFQQAPQEDFRPGPPPRTMTAPIPQNVPAFSRPGTAPPPQQNNFYEPPAPAPYLPNEDPSFRPGPPRRVGTAPINMSAYGPPVPSPYRGPPGPAGPPGPGGYRGPPPPRSGTTDPYNPRRGPPPQQRPGPGPMGPVGWQQQGGQYRY